MIEPSPNAFNLRDSGLRALTLPSFHAIALGWLCKFTIDVRKTQVSWTLPWFGCSKLRARKKRMASFITG